MVGFGRALHRGQVRTLAKIVNIKSISIYYLVFKLFLNLTICTSTTQNMPPSLEFFSLS